MTRRLTAADTIALQLAKTRESLPELIEGELDLLAMFKGQTARNADPFWKDNEWKLLFLYARHKQLLPSEQTIIRAISGDTDFTLAQNRTLDGLVKKYRNHKEDPKEPERDEDLYGYDDY